MIFIIQLHPEVSESLEPRFAYVRGSDFKTLYICEQALYDRDKGVI